MTELEKYIISIVENDEKYVSRATRYGYTIQDYIYTLKLTEIYNHMGIKENLFNYDLSKIEFNIRFNLILDPNYIKQQYAKFLIHMHLLIIINNYEFDLTNIQMLHRAEYNWHRSNNVTNPKKEFYLL